MSETTENINNPKGKTGDILGSIDIPSGEIGTSDKISSSNLQESLLPWEDSGIAETDTDTSNSLIQDSKIIDININSFEDLVTRLIEKEYDFSVIEPEDSLVKITFKQDNIDRNIIYIKYAVYTAILLKIKQVTAMSLENIKDAQEGKGNINIENTVYKVLAKTSPGQNGERIWCKAKAELTQNGQKKVKKASASMIFGFLGAILFVALVLGGAFITFVVLNAKTVDDVKFFASLGISLNNINDFLAQVVTIIFSILLFLLTIVLSISLFKFFLTKKTLKRKKLFLGLLSAVLLMSTFATGSAWMVIDQKIRNLPNWEEEAYGDLKIFDSALLVSGVFEKNDALVTQPENLIGPITLNFDLQNFQNSQERKGIKMTKYKWTFGQEIIESFTPTLTKEFTSKGNFELSITAIGTDASGKAVEQVLANTPNIGISHIISINETTTSNGGKRIDLDANSLSDIGKAVWYFKEPLTGSGSNEGYGPWTKIYEGYEFIPRNVFFEDMFIGLSVVSGDSENNAIDKVIAVKTKGDSKISGEIGYKTSLDNELETEFFIKNPSTSFANGFIESYEWKIETRTYTIAGNNTINENSPSVTHVFSRFGEQNIEVTLTDSKGETQTLKTTINIQKNVELKDSLVMYDGNDEKFVDFRYDSKSHEYFIKDIGIPATLKLDARYVRPSNSIYALQNVSWDLGNDKNIDATEKSYVFDIPTEGNHILSVEYTFVHRKNPEDIIKLKEFIYVSGVKKDAILDLKMEYESNYAPISVRFDASKSYIKNDNIIKFTYDYGDGISEERDAINPGHNYAAAGDYTVTLTVTGKTGKTYSIQKKLILLPPPQDVKISASLKKAPIGQGIDFSSSESSGQIIEYFWDFGDGETSTDANPTHIYKKSGIYKVKLKVEFVNNNSISDELEIEITQ